MFDVGNDEVLSRLPFSRGFPRQWPGFPCKSWIFAILSTKGIPLRNP